MKKIIVLLNLFVVALTFAQTNLTTTENYIYEKNCLTEDCSKKTESVQYFDGLGRAKQSVIVKTTPSGKDIAVPVEYDSYGRQLKSYLPIPQTGTQNGAIYSNPLSNASSQYGAEKIYTEKVPEASPLGRIQQQKQIGNDWASHPVEFSYASNTTADEVKKYTVATTWLEGRTNSMLNLSGTYTAGTLYKSAVTDEDGNTTTAFKNKKGQTVLTRKKDGTQNIDTYYVYNEYGQLAYTIPPLASASPTLTTSVLDNLCYQYRYDGWNRLVEKKIPGKGWEFMVYDQQDRLVLAQDANLRTTNNNFAAKGWMFTKYDQFGRVVYTGFFSNTATRTAMQTALNNMSANAANNETRSTTPFTLNGMDVYYTKTAFPTGSMKILSVNYYDTYPSYGFNPAFPTAIMGKSLLSDNSTANAVSTKDLPVMNLVKNIEDDNWTKNYVYYDTKGRIIGTYSINHLGGYTKTESDLDFGGVPQKSNVYHVRKPGESGITVKQRYLYDFQNRLLQHYHQVDTKPEELLSENTYNELSQLVNKKVGNNLQSIDYTYNIRGWLTEVNKNQMAAADLGGKLFSYRIKYNQKDGIANPDPAQFAGKNVVPRYNGNIAEVDWRAVESVGVNPSLTPKRYGYAYDSLNRITAGYYQNPNNPYSKENTESVSYDQNGNITSLYRTSVTEYGTNTATVIDNLSYAYAGNQATNIHDSSQNFAGYEGGGNTIVYDQNGNMTNMPDKGISSIKYNYLNLPNYLNLNRFGNEQVTINTKYRADGTRLRKENTTITTGVNGDTTTTGITDYLDGFQYFSSVNPSGGGMGSMSARAMQPQTFSIDQAKTTPPAKTPDLKFLPTAEGFYDYTKDQYIYQHKDHLGNVRVSYARNSAGALEIVDNNDYYPFGMNHLNSGTAFFGQGSYKNHKYNGKELQETGMYSYGWRDYMPDLGRWNGIDQLAESYLSTSTYAYVANNPISNTDPDGRWIYEDGSIGQAPSTWSMLGPKYKPYLSYSTSDGMGYNSGAGVSGAYSFTGNDAASMFNYFANGGNMSGITFKNGWAMWGTLEGNPFLEGYDGDMYVSNTGSVVLHRAKVEDSPFNWYGPGGKINWFIGAVGSGAGNFAEKYYIGTARPNAPVRFLGQNFYGNGRTFVKAGSVGRVIGGLSFGLGVAMDIRGMLIYKDNPTSPNAVHPAKAGLNTAMGLYGLTGAGTIPAILYFGVDAFYPGGWEGYGNDYQRIQSENAAIVPGFITAPYGSQKF